LRCQGKNTKVLPRLFILSCILRLLKAKQLAINIQDKNGRMTRCRSPKTQRQKPDNPNALQSEKQQSVKSWANDRPQGNIKDFSHWLVQGLYKGFLIGAACHQGFTKVLCLKYDGQMIRLVQGF
jgi:hypothetical protein